MDQLKNALSSALGQKPPEETAPILPDPARSEWAMALIQSGANLPAKPTLGQLRARSDALVKELKNAGRKRESAALQSLRDEFEKEREKLAWAAIKERFEEQALSERAYRALKQTPQVDAVEVLNRLLKSKGTLQGAGADKIRDTLLGKA
jgi:hypothetical protein